ncbi:MAG: hypothetical protein JXO22_07185 [Phycisphaerae bacterium]|nr:hypothetical protein [Phycisphaerae bacterium]
MSGICKMSRSRRGGHLFELGLCVSIVLAVFSSTAALAADEELPKAEQIIERSIESSGGKEALEKLTNRMMVAKIVFGGVGVEGTVTSYTAAPRNSYSRMEIKDLGVVEEGCNGEVAWENSAMMGPRIKSGEELEVALRTYTFNADLVWREMYKEYETKGIVDVDGKPAYDVLLTPNAGKPEHTYYDQKTYLPVVNKATMTTPMGDIEVETHLSDYRKVDGIMMPFKITQTAGPQQITIEVQKIEHNVKIPEGQFDLPDDIKALVEKAAYEAKMPKMKLDKKEP